MRHGTLTVPCPGEVIWITPPQLHKHLEVLFNAGIPLTRTVGDPGAHGPAMTGMQGTGVSTPIAAAVAATTMGLASELHMPNGAIFSIGAISIMLAAGTPALTILTGSTVRTEGAKPNEHAS